jgi:2-phosphosulfolactate phosphatase
MAAALQAGVSEIRIFGDIQSAREAASAYCGPKLLCGEQACLPPPGFDLGNSPGAFSAEHAGKVLFMCTTNGTRAIVHASGAPRLLIAAVVNARFVARHLLECDGDVTFLCAGTDGQVSMEDVIGAGAVLDAMGEVMMLSDRARIARRLFRSCDNNLRQAFEEAAGGRNVIRAGLGRDVEFAARRDSIAVVGEVRANPLRVVRV